MEQNNFQIRQGDVMVERIEELPSDAVPVETKEKRVVLAYGEVTGHCHQIKSGAKEFNFSGDKFGKRLLKISNKPVNIDHEEHSTIQIPKGTYRIIQQMEYQQEIRPVFD